MIKINSARWCNTLENLFGCSTKKSFLRRKDIFDLTSLDLRLQMHLTEPSPYDLLR